MAKDAYYFPHDANAQNDPKILNIIEELGPEGVGIFWMLIELLRDQQNYELPLSIVAGLSRRWNTTKEKIITVIKRYGLFQVNQDKFFFSQTLKDRMLRIDDLRYKLAEAGRKGGLSKAKARLQQPSSIKEKERKENEMIEEEDASTTVFFQIFRRASGKHITDEELTLEVGKFLNKYPNAHPNQSGALINTWVSNIGRVPEPEKRMVI